jgi:hypothetical protein
MVGCHQIISILCHTDELAALLGRGRDEGPCCAALFIRMNNMVAVACAGTTCTTDVTTDDGGYTTQWCTAWPRGFSVRWPAATGGLSSPNCISVSYLLSC